jgi:hypothetical protein
MCGVGIRTELTVMVTVYGLLYDVVWWNFTDSTCLRSVLKCPSF